MKIFSVLQTVRSLIQSDEMRTSLDKIEGGVSAALETVADQMAGVSKTDLSDGLVDAQSSLVALMSKHRIDRHSPEFLAGRLSALIDILGYADIATVSDESVMMAKSSPFIDVLVSLHPSGCRPSDLAVKLADPEAVSTVKRLISTGFVTTYRHGQETMLGLSPIGRMLAEDAFKDNNKRESGE